MQSCICGPHMGRMAEGIQLNYSQPAQAPETKKWFGQQTASKEFDIKASCISISNEEILPWGLFLNILKDALHQGMAEDGFVNNSLVAGGNGCSICLKCPTTIVERKTPTGLYTTGVPARLPS